MRAHHVIGKMSPGDFERVFGKLNEESPESIQGATIGAAQILKFRPKFLLKQPLAKRINSIKGALSRVTGNQISEELLAVYFLKCRLDLLEEWLDLMGLEHEEGILTQEELPCPEEAELKQKVERFRDGEADEDRELLIRVFASQPAIDWPALEALLARD